MYIPKATSYWEAIAGGIKAISGATEMLNIYSDGTYSEIDGIGGAGTDLYLFANSGNSYPNISLTGNSVIDLSCANNTAINLYESSTKYIIFDATSGYYSMAIKETSTSPTNVVGFGQLYTKSDNKLYFRDGDGTEHTVAFV